MTESLAPLASVVQVTIRCEFHFPWWLLVALIGDGATLVASVCWLRWLRRRNRAARCRSQGVLVSPPVGAAGATPAAPSPSTGE